ncbi:MAG: hypothetical protein VW491_07315 [Gammaproteobacteria bacterium]
MAASKSGKEVYNARTVRLFCHPTTECGGNDYMDVYQYAFFPDTNCVARGTVRAPSGDDVDVVLKLCTPQSHDSTKRVMQSKEYTRLSETPGVDTAHFVTSGHINTKRARQFCVDYAQHAHIETLVRGVTLEHVWNNRTDGKLLERIRSAYRHAATINDVFTVGIVDMEHVSTPSVAPNIDVLEDSRVSVNHNIPAERAILHRALMNVRVRSWRANVANFVDHVLLSDTMCAQNTDALPAYLPEGAGTWSPSVKAVESTAQSWFKTLSRLNDEEFVFAHVVIPAVCRLAKACTNADVYLHDARLSNIVVDFHSK